ncbi:acyl-CoA-binding protein [Tenacibaculum finnmarkense genomovar finnmarkense]|uniref:acyl-CoA-binding protein n=1 Tax=Tenacibaculum finnmarkense TaxID=2781243 RepID=UPI00187BA146|nr:acyl-CoA-binding protein [Tenacibaculum finnmarkense]MBE7661137.1 phosphatidylserine decarboxylase [Tenacibaculum finnmarkense genomovar finnmarkense]MCD8417661.1 acyl-CoA-binding protein [Tenacibaculum finnmarkense genomovar finnmarkense]MCG8210037.1 acyl-CoA-binding protein [Tenacibaculum finnmarkense genomovar finnmarkense]MCG8212800.1 acyl-CoA-binding protein [Tenacibaculum finnmarkense genomovar finnmarkense]MCG8220190.1 acyl-CoA-binding protein [Tenacibaculum finnmarkense genomovar fi
MLNTLDIQFKEAYEKASSIKEKLPPDTMLRLYSYYKQAVKGDMFALNDNDNLRNGFKFNAWIQLRGMNENQAKQEYINLINSIIK